MMLTELSDEELAAAIAAARVAAHPVLADLRDNLRDLPLGNSLHSRYEAALRRLGAIA